MRTKWNGWGAPDKFFSLQDRPAFQQYLSDKLGIYYFSPIPALTLDEITLPPTRLTDGARSDLRTMIGSENVREDVEARAGHSVGKSYAELIQARRGEMPHLPDAVVFPGAAREIREVLSWASDNNVAVIPFGGGTGVVGGVQPQRALGQEMAIVLDLERLDKILFIDEKSQIAKVEPGIRGPTLEECLQSQGFTLGHYPPSFEFSTLGGWIATRSVGQYAFRYGRIDDLVLGLSVETPAGPLEISGPPARSTGPEIREVFVGSEGCLGIITLAEMRLHRKAEVRRTAAFLLPGFEQGVDVVREVVHLGSTLALSKLSDEDELEFTLSFERRSSGLGEIFRRNLDRLILGKRGFGRPVMLLLEFHGSESKVRRDFREVAGFVEGRGGYELGDKPGRNFHRDRFLLPYVRDALMDVGILHETLETAVSWSNLKRLHVRVKESLTKACSELGARSIVQCHISHGYSSGASLTFTVLAPVGPGEELKFARAIKLAGTEAILHSGGTLSHHSGIGSQHREWILQEHGPLAVAAMRALKETFDPAGIMNPGKLIP